eukprot:6098462-Lingulodinium_polyedra.AAC.1
MAGMACRKNEVESTADPGGIVGNCEAEDPGETEGKEVMAGQEEWRKKEYKRKIMKNKEVLEFWRL